MSKIKLKKLGNKVRYYRKLRGISQEKLAELISLSRNYIGMIERAEVNTPVGTIFDIAKVLKIDTKDLFDFK